MKTLSLRNWVVGRSVQNVLLKMEADERLDLKSGLYVLVGPNGVGKSTFLHSLAGICPLMQGEVWWEDRKIHPQSLLEKVLLLPEYLTFPKYVTGNEWISFFQAPKKGDATFSQTWIEAFGLTKKIHQPLGRMSQGERRKVSLLLAAQSNRPVLLLDEPLDGLDLWAIEVFRKLLKTWKEEGRVIILVAHQAASILDLVDDVLILRSKKVSFWTREKELSKHVFQQATASQFQNVILQYYKN